MNADCLATLLEEKQHQALRQIPKNDMLAVDGGPNVKGCILDNASLKEELQST
jgi:hypothetical protein